MLSKMKTQVLARVLDGEQLQCVVTAPSGKNLTLSGKLEDLRPEAEGATDLLRNPALIDNSWAYAKFKYWTVRLESAEEQESAKKQAALYRRNAVWIAELADNFGGIQLLAWCSACFEKTDHQQVVRPFGQLKTFLCSNCGSPTTPCVGPGCANMAVREPRAVKLPRSCAEHRHDIPGFEKAGNKLEKLEDYTQLLKFDRPRLARINKLASLAAAGIAVGVTGGALLAPAVGGAIGTFIGGYSGAAATSWGLALLGGGSLAAGGLGMAGGTYVVAALGAAIGGTLGMSITSAYVQEDKSFQIVKLRDGEGPAVVLSSGFLTESTDGWSGWQSLVESYYPGAPVYRVQWGAKELKDLGFVAGAGTAKLLVNQGMKQAAAKAAKIGAKKLGPLGMALLVADLIGNPWHVAKNRADKTGVILADILSRVEGNEFVLMGHSLGARVMAVAAQTLGSNPNAPKVREVRLFGAAIGADGDWHTLNSSVEQTAYNYYSRNDSVLKFFYTAAQLGQSPAGLFGFKNALPKMQNIDVSAVVEGHSDYFTAQLGNRTQPRFAEGSSE